MPASSGRRRFRRLRRFQRTAKVPDWGRGDERGRQRCPVSFHCHDGTNDHRDGTGQRGTRVKGLSVGTVEVMQAAVFAGVMGAALLSAIWLIRERARIAAENGALRGKVADLNASLQRTEALLNLRDQRVVIWAGEKARPEVIGTLPPEAGAPEERAGFLAFGNGCHRGRRPRSNRPWPGSGKRASASSLWWKRTNPRRLKFMGANCRACDLFVSYRCRRRSACRPA